MASPAASPRIAANVATHQLQRLLLLAVLCLGLLQAVAAETRPDPFCTPAQGTPALYNAKGQLVPQTLPRRAMMPAQLPAKSTLDREGGTYSWLYKQINNFLGWSPCPLSNTKPYPEPVGWKLAAVLNITSTYGGKFTQVPTAAVLRPVNASVSRQLVVVIRGAAYSNESRINFDYGQIAAPVYGDGLVHKAYKAAADEMWGDDTAGLQALLQKFIVNAGSAAITSVLISGHSMGGGIGTLLASRAQKYLAEQCSSAATPAPCKFLSPSLRAKPLVSLVALAACNAGNAAFAADFNKRVNARLVDFELDRVTAFLTGYYAAPGWPKPSTPVKYKRVGGVVRLTAQDMPFQSSVWSTVANGIYNSTNSAFLGADAFETWADAVDYKIAMGLMYPRGLLYSASAHLCSYMCALSAYVADSKGEWCLLHAAGAADLAAASYCSNFPPYAIAAVFPTTPAFP